MDYKIEKRRIKKQERGIVDLIKIMFHFLRNCQNGLMRWKNSLMKKTV